MKENTNSIFNLTKNEIDNLISTCTMFHYDLPVVVIEDGVYYAIARNEEEANKACFQYISYTYWAFTDEFLSDVTGMDKVIFETLHSTGKAESLNDAFKALITFCMTEEEFVEKAVKEDGRGPYLSHYDSKEYEHDCGYLIYRID